MSVALVKTGPARTLLHGSRYQLQQCSVSLEAAAAAVLCRVTDVFMNDWRGVARPLVPGQARRGSHAAPALSLIRLIVD